MNKKNLKKFAFLLVLVAGGSIELHASLARVAQAGRQAAQTALRTASSAVTQPPTGEVFKGLQQMRSQSAGLARQAFSKSAGEIIAKQNARFQEAAKLKNIQTQAAREAYEQSALSARRFAQGKMEVRNIISRPEIDLATASKVLGALALVGMASSVGGELLAERESNAWRKRAEQKKIKDELEASANFALAEIDNDMSDAQKLLNQLENLDPSSSEYALKHLEAQKIIERLPQDSAVAIRMRALDEMVAEAYTEATKMLYASFLGSPYDQVD